MDVHHCPAFEKPAVTAASTAAVDVGVLHHDERVLAAELELRARQVGGGHRLDLLAHLGRAGERDRAYARILHEDVARLPSPRRSRS